MKTTLAGALLAGFAALGLYQNNGGDLADWKLWVIPTGIAILSYLVPDKPKETPPTPPNRLGRLPMALLFAASVPFLSPPACTGITSGITGQTPHTTAVKRVEGEGKVINIATRDLIRAETSPPEEAWGLYNIGAVARATQQIADSGK